MHWHAVDCCVRDHVVGSCLHVTQLSMYSTIEQITMTQSNIHIQSYKDYHFVKFVIVIRWNEQCALSQTVNCVCINVNIHWKKVYFGVLDFDRVSLSSFFSFRVLLLSSSLSSLPLGLWWRRLLHESKQNSQTHGADSSQISGESLGTRLQRRHVKLR